MSTDRRARANELVDELRRATEEVLALVGPRAVVVSSGETLKAGPVIDEEFDSKWRAALQREREAWQAWEAFTQKPS